eukprot:967436_1
MYHQKQKQMIIIIIIIIIMKNQKNISLINSNGDGNITKSDDDCDESSPLNSKKEKEIDIPAQINISNNNNVQATNNKVSSTPSKSISNRKQHKQELGSDSDNDTECQPINLPPINNGNKLKSKKSDLFKISVTKPNKKKAIGTSLFGGDISTSKRDSNSRNINSQKETTITFGKPINKPIFSSNNSNSSRSTSFIVGDLGTPKFGDDGLPKFSDAIKRSNTLTLDSSHKDKLNQRRQSSLAVRRNQNRRNLPIKINKVWSIFAQFIVDKLIEERERERAEKKYLNKISESPEVTPEPHSTNISPRSDNAVLDEIINRNRDDKNNKKKTKDNYFEEDTNGGNGGNDATVTDRKKGHESMEVLQIDPRLFMDAKSRSSASASSDSSSNSSSSSSGRDSTSSLDSDTSGDSHKSESDTIDVYTIELTYT